MYALSPPSDLDYFATSSGVSADDNGGVDLAPLLALDAMMAGVGVYAGDISIYEEVSRKKQLNQRLNLITSSQMPGFDSPE